MDSWAFIVGFIMIFILVAIGAIIFSKRSGEGKKYDERQQLLRGQAYKAAFWVLVAYMCANGLFVFGTDIVWADAMTSAFIGICIAATVFVVLCISRDAYFAINQKPGFYCRLFCALTLINLTIGIVNLLDTDRPLFADGMLSFRSMNFVVVGMFIAILTAIAVRHFRAKAGSGAEES